MKSSLGEAACYALRSPPARGAWIEIDPPPSPVQDPAQSPPARGAWIEIPLSTGHMRKEQVAPRTGGVD